MRNVEATLKQAGLDFRHVVMSNIFLDRYENLEVNRQGLQRIFRGWQRAGGIDVVCRLDSRADRTSRSRASRRPIWPLARS